MGEFNISKLYKATPEKNYFENKFYIFDGGKRYKGEWNLNGEPHGFGVLFYTDGSKYEGEFRFGKQEGYGRILHHNGDVYYGKWTNDRADGYGVFKDASGARYEGEWKMDK